MNELPVGEAARSDRAANPFSSLQESFIRLQQAEQLRQRGKFDEAQSICE